MGYFVYAIYNIIKNKIYIGQTRDMNLRLRLHNEKVFKSYTSKFDGCWELIYLEKQDSRKLALIREHQLKSYRGREFVKNLIDNSRVAQR